MLFPPFKRILNSCGSHMKNRLLESFSQFRCLQPGPVYPLRAIVYFQERLLSLQGRVLQTRVIHAQREGERRTGHGRTKGFSSFPNFGAVCAFQRCLSGQSSSSSAGTARDCLFHFERRERNVRQRAGVAPTRFNARAATVQQRKQRSWNPPREPVNILYGRARRARRREERVPRGCRRLVNQGRAGGSATMPRSSARGTDPPLSPRAPSPPRKDMRQETD